MLGAIGLVLALYWMYDTYVKTILWLPSDFGLMQADYIVMRNSVDGQTWIPNASIYAQQYRAVGLYSSYALTSTLVTLGLFAVLSFQTNSRMWRKFAIGTVGILILSVGGGTTALVLFAMIFPIVIICLRLPQERIKSAEAWMAMLAVALVLFFATAIASQSALNKLLMSRIEIFQAQLHFLINLSKQEIRSSFGTTLNTSYPELYVNSVKSTAHYLTNNPIVALVGEGRKSAQAEAFPRGGDFGLMDWVVTFGLPLVASLLAVLSLGSYKSFQVLSGRAKRFDADGLIMFAGSALLFVLGSLIHYNVAFDKTLLPITMFSIGLAHRFSGNLQPLQQSSLDRPHTVNH